MRTTAWPRSSSPNLRTIIRPQSPTRCGNSSDCSSPSASTTSHGTAFLGASQNSTLSPHEAATHAPARVPSCQQHPMGRQFRAPRGTRHQLLHSSIALHFSCKCTIPPSPTALRRVPAPTPYGELTAGSNPLTHGSSSCLHRSTQRSRGAQSRRAQASSSMELFLYHQKPSRISADTSLIPTPLRS
jgi:hypothetical protein